MTPFESLCETLQEEFPRLQIAYKDESRTQELIAGLLATFGNLRYLTDFTTVMPGWTPTVWFPSRAFVARDPDRAARILLHERVHLHDLRREPVRFVSTYLVSKRAYWERRAYAVDIVLARRRGLDYDAVLSWLVQVFTGPDYLYMWPDPGAVQGWVARVWRDGLETELSGELLTTTQSWVDRLGG